MNSVYLKRFVTTLLLLACMTAIFLFSGQDAEESSDTSSGMSRKIAAIVYPEFENLSSDEQTEAIESIEHPIRKIAHFTIFFVLSAVSYLCFSTYKFFNFKIGSFTAVIFSVLYAISDEIHQYFVPGRSCEIRDVLIDTSGIVLAFLILTLFDRKFQFSKRLGEKTNA